MESITLTVDGKEVQVPKGYTILQACEEAGKEIPRFCYHERLSIAGNCRMCLVEVEGGPPKPVASCAMPAAEGMKVKTESEMTKRARNGVMEFLLINHPLDCPICDQGGECDLQDQSMAYGIDHSRYYENKRAVEDKYMGPLIKTIMTRCIHCTRCVRFVSEVGGSSEIGATGRGEDMEITTYLEEAVGSELSGNVIDLCPVGALTSKPYAFTARPWELRKTESVDVVDAVGTAIRVDSRGREVMRIMPRLNEDVNEEWIADRSRFIWDGLRAQRLDRPYVKRDGRLTPASWDEAFAAIADRIQATAPEKMAALAGDLADTESMFALKSLMAGLGVTNLDCRQDGSPLGEGPREGYLFNTTIAGIEDADALLLIGTDPRREAPLINARIRKAWLESRMKIGLIGEAPNLTFPYEHLGNGPETLKAVMEGSHSFADVLKGAKRPMLILGQGALARPDGRAVLHAAAEIARKTGMLVAAESEEPGWNGFNVLHTAGARVGGLDVGFLPGDGGKGTAEILAGAESGAIDFVWLLNADEIDTARLGKAFVVYQGHHGDAGAHRADVILPGAAYTEKNALWVNTEGRVQLGKRGIFPPGEAKEDWAILRAFSAKIGATLPFDNQGELRQKLMDAHPALTSIGYPPGADNVGAATLDGVGSEGVLDGPAFRTPIDDPYMVNPILRASKTMAECSAIYMQKNDQKVEAAE